MNTHETEAEIALQPETEVEQALLAELFTRLNNITEAASHPDKVGSVLVHYSLDVDWFDGLDHELAETADCRVNEHGKLDPEPGSRALIVVHGDQPDAEAEKELEEKTEEAVEEAVEEVKEAEVSDENEYVEDVEDVIERVYDANLDPDEADYDELQELAKDVSTTGIADIPANQSTEDLCDALQDVLRATV